jgi:hypothetical protein
MIDFLRFFSLKIDFFFQTFLDSFLDSLFEQRRSEKRYYDNGFLMNLKSSDDNEFDIKVSKTNEIKSENKFDFFLLFFSS